MRGVWFEEYERLYNLAEEGESEPDPQAVTEAVVERLSVSADRYRDAQKYKDFDF